MHPGRVPSSSNHSPCTNSTHTHTLNLLCLSCLEKWGNRFGAQRRTNACLLSFQCVPPLVDWTKVSGLISSNIAENPGTLAHSENTLCIFLLFWSQTPHGRLVWLRPQLPLPFLETSHFPKEAGISHLQRPHLYHGGQPTPGPRLDRPIILCCMFKIPQY